MSAENVDAARQLLEQRARELRAELTRIDQAIRSLRDRQPTRGRGRRANQALELIAENPGITIRELASRMGLNGPHYLYRVLPRLEAEKLISKDGNGYRAGKR